MILEKIFKKEDGSRVKVIVQYSSWADRPSYIVTVLTCEKGKRKFIEVDCDQDPGYRDASMAVRRIHRMNKYLLYVAGAEIMEVCNELHTKLAPTVNNLEACN